MDCINVYLIVKLIMQLIVQQFSIPSNFWVLISFFTISFFTSLINNLPKVNGRTYPPRRLAVVASAVVVASLCLHIRRWSHCRCSGWMPIPAGVRLRPCLGLSLLDTSQYSLSVSLAFSVEPFIWANSLSDVRPVISFLSVYACVRHQY